MTGVQTCALPIWATLSFSAKIKSFEADDLATVSVSADGRNWDIVKQFTAADSGGKYNRYDIDLTPYGLSERFWIAIDSDASPGFFGLFDTFYIDDISIR